MWSILINSHHVQNTLDSCGRRRNVVLLWNIEFVDLGEFSLDLCPVPFVINTQSSFTLGLIIRLHLENFLQDVWRPPVMMLEGSLGSSSLSSWMDEVMFVFLANSTFAVNLAGIKWLGGLSFVALCLLSEIAEIDRHRWSFHVFHSSFTPTMLTNMFIIWPCIISVSVSQTCWVYCIYWYVSPRYNLNLSICFILSDNPFAICWHCWDTFCEHRTSPLPWFSTALWTSEKVVAGFQVLNVHLGLSL